MFSYCLLRVNGSRLLAKITIYLVISADYSAGLFIRFFRKTWQNQLCTPTIKLSTSKLCGNTDSLLVTSACQFVVPENILSPLHGRFFWFEATSQTQWNFQFSFITFPYKSLACKTNLPSVRYEYFLDCTT